MFLYHHGFSQFSKETGFFPIKNFTPEDYNNAMPKNSAIIQDLRGVMYFGNDEGVLEYDGIRWKLYTLSNGASVHSLAIDIHGRVYIGAVNEFGYLAPNTNGKLNYVSLTNQLDDSLKNSFTVWNVHCNTEGVYFQTDSYLFRWDGSKIIHWNAKSEFHTSFKLNDKVITKQINDGLFYINNNKLIDVEGDELLHKTSIFSIIPKDNENFLVVTRNHGFYNLKLIDGFNRVSVNPLFEDLLKIVKPFDLINALRINENTYSIGTWGSGLLIFQQGLIVQIITKKSGLSDEVINNQFLDKDGNLWLALSDGITKIEINSPLSKFNEELGVDGSIVAIARFDENLYIATERGLLLLLFSEWSTSNQIYDQNKFKKVKTFLGGLWDLLNYDHDGEQFLLIASDNSVLQMDKNLKFEEIYACYPWRLYQSKINPNHIFVGLDNGLTLLARKNGKWDVAYDFPEISEKVFTITEDDEGNLWLGTKGQGVIKISGKSLDKLSNLEIERFDYSSGLPENTDIYLTNYLGKVIFGTNRGIFEIIENSDSVALSHRFPSIISNSDRIITQMKPDKNNKLWVTSFIRSKRAIEAGYLTPDETEFKWINTPFNTISKGDLFSLHFDKDGIVWFGGSAGLFRFDPSVEKNYEKDFAALIRLNIIGQDSTIFFGSYFDDEGFVTTIQPEVLKPKLKYKYNTLQFDFSAQNTEIDHPVLFSYYLEGYDKNWSDWSEESKRYYTNLFEGKYIFRVKAKNIYNHESKEAFYEFSILPPWYRTIIAYISYVLLLTGLIFLIVKQYTKYLRAVIREKTKEIRHQKEIVEHKNEEITASIKYAQRIQHALLPPSEILVESNIDHFILFKPRDIVSGDFYWFRKIGEFTVIVAADCTGHGVPGAFVSMLGMAFLNEISIEIKEVKANEMLNALRALVIKSLRQTGKPGESKDGMDIALYIIDKKNNKIQFAGANNPLVIIRNKEIIQYKGDRMPIGHHLVMDEFQNNEIDVEKGDMLYTFSDGYQDQFGGENASKFMIKKLKEIMVELSDKPLEEQKHFFDETIESWKGPNDQVDDILLIGVRI
jgi:serine phosphatase RsbU (regulator of sigma subunit)/ligand-binding sensor domain-containing protein